MELTRKPYQGVWNIIRFNRHFYIGAFVILGFLLLIGIAFPEYLNLIALFCFSGIAVIMMSLMVSYYVYDGSDLYQLNWLNEVPNDGVIININAGFDETSEMIRHKKSHARLTVCDFYDAEKHTEISIRRAREAYPADRATVCVTTDHLPFPDNRFDAVVVTFAAHEIRNYAERISFFDELKRIVAEDGRIYITEHLRDTNNFIAYTIGFLHFYSRNSWLRIFESSGLQLTRELKTTPFVTTFILSKNGNSL